MPLNEIPKFFSPEMRKLIESALEDAWQELRKDGLADTDPARMKLAKTIVALAAVGETDAMKLKWFALHAARHSVNSASAVDLSGILKAHLGRELMNTPVNGLPDSTLGAKKTD